MSLLEDFIQAVQNKTGWKSVKLNNQMHHCFNIQGKDKEKIELELFSPEGTILIMQTKLCTLPQDNYEKNEMLKDYAKRQVGACKKRASVVSLENNSLILYRKEKMQNTETLLEILGEFLKDADWWKQKNNSRGSNPFSFSMPW